MLSENRLFHYTGELNITRSKILNDQCQPKDDTVNWFFLKIGEYRYSFVYKILSPLKAKYNTSFEIYFSFLMIESAKNLIELDKKYEVFRGEEFIGYAKILDVI